MIAILILICLAVYVGWINYKKKIDLGDLSEDIDKDLHIHEPAGEVYKFKNNKYGKVS